MDIQQIIADLTPKKGCWVAQLTGDAADLMAGIEAFEDAGGKVSRKETADKLVSWGVTTSQQKVKYHLNRECKCRPPK